MAGFTKLVSEIITSSIWSADDPTRIVWITILALKDEDGFVAASLSGLANAARETIETTKKAVEILEAIDSESRSSEYEGRRIAKVEGGWIVLNHYKYREKERVERRREYMRKYMKAMRAEDASVNNQSSQEANKSLPSASASVYVSASSDGTEKGCGEKEGKLRRMRNPLMDALGKLDAAGGNVSQITKSGWSSIDGALRDIREVTPEVMPEEIERRAANYRTQFPADTRITAHALAKHWARCAEPGQKVARPVAERRHVDPRI